MALSVTVLTALVALAGAEAAAAYGFGTRITSMVVLPTIGLAWSVEAAEDGFIEVNESFETTPENMWAFGDIVGKYMFWHWALREAEIVYRNGVHDSRWEANHVENKVISVFRSCYRNV